MPLHPKTLVRLKKNYRTGIAALLLAIVCVTCIVIGDWTGSLISAIGAYGFLQTKDYDVVGGSRQQ